MMSDSVLVKSDISSSHEIVGTGGRNGRSGTIETENFEFATHFC